MELILAYGIFALATAIVSVYELYWPVLKSISISHPEHTVSEYPAFTAVVCGFLTLIFAPFVFPACIVPSKGERFRNKFWESLLAR